MIRDLAWPVALALALWAGILGGTRYERHRIAECITTCEADDEGNPQDCPALCGEGD